MKKGGLYSALIFELPTHPHSAMNSDTKALLRHTILEAINSEQDAAAMELLALLAGSTPIAQPAPAPTPATDALPAARCVIQGPARDYHYWASFIRENFIPHIVNNGRFGFTSNQLFSWLVNNRDMQWTTGDVELRSDGFEMWRNTASHGLTALKERGVIKAKPRSRDYVIAQLLPARNNLNGLLNAGAEVCGFFASDAEPAL